MIQSKLKYGERHEKFIHEFEIHADIDWIHRVTQYNWRKWYADGTAAERSM